jgi:hypothetical protein
MFLEFDLAFHKTSHATYYKVRSMPSRAWPAKRSLQSSMRLIKLSNISICVYMSIYFCFPWRVQSVHLFLCPVKAWPCEQRR